MAIKIESGIPIPDVSRKGRPIEPNSIRSLVRKMQIGDSMFLSKSAAGQALTRGAEEKFKMTRRKEGDGYRVWRIA